MVVVALLVAGGATALAASGSGDGGYRMGKAVHASVASNLVVVGTIEPVNDASASFQVAGQVATVTAVPGAQVTAGETLASLDTTSLSESVSSAELSLQSDDAKLTEDEDSETSGTGTTTTTTTTPKASTSTGGAGGSGAGGSSPQGSISQDQATLVADQATSSADQQKEAADLAQAQKACGVSPTPTNAPPTSTTTTTTTTTTTSPTTSSGDTACTAAVQQVSTDQQAVATDERTVASDESTLAKAITQQESSAGSGGTTSAATGTSASGGTSARGNAASGSASDSAAQIASDEAAIDTAQSNVISAQQSLAEGQLTSPINGTVVSVGISAGDTVSADSSTEDIVIIGTKSFEATATLTSAQVPSVKVGAVGRRHGGR